ncbi:MAG: hypothetical protein Q8909_07685 [Bacteroidota bacterium]|nr:hypothetical protein [Bacteroidota bacterium]
MVAEGFGAVAVLFGSVVVQSGVVAALLWKVVEEFGTVAGGFSAVATFPGVVAGLPEPVEYYRKILNERVFQVYATSFA